VAALSLVLAGATSTAAEFDWAKVRSPAPPPAHAIGDYARGCLAGAVALPADGPNFQVMRPSRDRFYGHPRLIRFVEEFAAAMRAQGWDGLLVGDLAQPRGGPMGSGHSSHQTGLDVDFWLQPAGHPLSDAERENRSAVSVVSANGETVDPTEWTDAHARLLRTAAGFAEIERIFVAAAIKRKLCATTPGDRGWLAKIRPWWGHADHFHIRLRCPPEEAACRDQAAVPPGDGCDETLAWWFSDDAKAELERLRKLPPKRLTLDDLPPACRSVFTGS
jgi:penicillin-insensitive murein endopeptidase